MPKITRMIPTSPVAPPAVAPAYSVQLARSADELAWAQRLRFEVFNLELQEGLAGSFAIGRDEDEFDPFCDHLIATDERTGQVVGTYRLQTGQAAALHLGYYCAQEFDMSPYEALRCEIVELGRACVHREHRNFAVLSMLWKGIAVYARQRKARYLVGCSSLSSQDPALGHATYETLRADFLAPSALCTQPLPSHVLPEGPPLPAAPPLPRLLRAYLGLGAWICGEPALDRVFGTIDFLTLLDLHALSPAAAEHFLR